MIRLINADELKENEPHYDEEGYRIFYESEIDNAPTIKSFTLDDIEGVRAETIKMMENRYARPQGEWKYNQYDGNANIGNWHCSECRHIVYGGYSQKPYYNFCPNCGADMRKGDAE